MKKLLITGGCGFIGTNAARYFAQRGYEVLAVDNFSRPGSEENVKVLRAEGIACEQLDIVTQSVELAALVRTRGIEVILHAAAQVAVTTSVHNPVFDFNQNALGTLNVLEAARNAPQKPIVLFTSTNKVYGGLEQFPAQDGGKRYVLPELPQGVHENVLIDFHSPYGCSKGAADQYTRDYERIYDLPTVVFRQSCIYGPHQFGIVDQGWVAFLTMQAYFGKPITIYGDGKQVRDVLSVSDLCRAFEAAFGHIGTTRGKIYNMGGGATHSVSLLEYVDFLEKRLGKKLDVRFADWRPGDQRVYVSDISKAKRDFVWEPQQDLPEGFEAMFAWIEQNARVLEKFV
jgi:CDP-paratose 2-epimerase